MRMRGYYHCDQSADIEPPGNQTTTLFPAIQEPVNQQAKAASVVCSPHQMVSGNAGIATHFWSRR